MELLFAEDICHWTEKEIQAKMYDRTPFRLQFEDGEIISNWQETILSWFFWEAIRDYPLTPVLVKHHFNGDDMAIEGKIQNRVHNSVLAAYPDEDRENVEAATYRAKNKLHNFFTTKGEEFAATIDALVLLEIWSHPEIKQAVADCPATKNGINQMYAKITKIINTSPDLRYNSLANASRAGLIKVAQLHQVLSYRGFCSEVDQRIFPNMVAAGFAEGIHRPSFLAQVSRDASKALQATDDPVKQTEYYNRELQLFTFVLKGVEIGDCGSDETIPWEVKASELDAVLPGNYYVLHTGEVRAIKTSDRHLIGQTIQLRNVACCWHPDDGMVCSTCVGKIGERVQKGTNLGHASTVTQNEKVSQDVISTKHLLISALSEWFQIDPFYAAYLINTSEISELMLSPEVWNRHVELEIDMRYLSRLADIHTRDSFTHADLQRISHVQDITMIIHHDDEKEKATEIVIPVSHGSYRPYFTEEFIFHLKDYGFTNEGRKIRVDMRNWDSSESLLKFPERHASTLEMMAELKSNIFMSSPDSKAKLRMDLTDPDILSSAIKDICDMTNRKFSVNLSIVSLVLYAMMSRDPKHGDYRLPKKGTGRHFDTKVNIMNGRSLSQKAAYEKQFTMIQSPKSYLNILRPNHVFDWLLLDVDKARAASKKKFDL